MEQVLVFNKSEWLAWQSLFGWSEEEIDNADERGLIGRKFGIDCYVTRPIECFKTLINT